MHSVWLTVTRSTNKLKLAIFTSTLITASVLPMLSNPGIAHATGGINNTRGDAWGTQEVAASGWLNGNGVPIYSNGSTAGGPYPDTYNYVNNTNGTSTQTGVEWQCVELVNRLYITKGWITSTWSGNGTDLFGNAPTTLLKEANGQITYINPGDVVGFSGGPSPFLGHVAVVNTVSANSGGGYSVQIASQNTDQVYDGTVSLSSGGTLSISGWSQYSIEGVIHAPSLFVIRSGNTLQGKTNLGDSWTTLASYAADVRLSGTRITQTDTSGVVWAKDGLSGTWYNEGTNPTQYAFSNSLFVIRSGNTLYGKAGLNDSWTTLASYAADVQVSDNRIAYTDTSGIVRAKDGLSGTWITEGTNPTQYAFSNSLFVIRSGNTLYGIAGLTDSWTTLASYAADVRVSGGRITQTDTAGVVWAKDGLSGTWNNEVTSPSQYAASSRLLVIRSSTTLQGKVKLDDNWTTLSSYATDTRVTNNRITYTDTSGVVWAKDGLNGTWYNEVTNPTQYASS